MTFRALVRACISLRASACAVLAMLAVPAHAVPPAFTGAQIVANPNGTQIFINLRQQGVVTGSAPLTVTVGQLFINGVLDPTDVIGIDPTDPLPLDGGAICIELEDEGFNPAIHLTAAIQLTITNPLNQNATAIVPITLTPGPTVSQVDPLCSDPNATPTANAGPDRTIVDTDAQPGEIVVLDASASTDANADNVLTYQWFEDGEFSLGPASTSPLLSVPLTPGAHNITLVVNDDSGDQATAVAIDDLTITVAAPNIPTVNAGLDRSIADTDRNPGENVTLSGSAIDLDGTIVGFQWLSGTTSLGTGATITVRLPNGVNTITLRVTDNAGNIGIDTVQITVEVPAQRPVLTQLPNLDPTQQRTASALDRICTDLDSRDDTGGTLTPDQRQLLDRCNGIYFNNSAGNQIRALEELIADDFAVARTQTLLFANTQYVSVMDRLIALRGGARGLSLAGLNIMVDGKAIPLAKLQDLAETLFGDGARKGGGASADEPGGLLSDKLGIWARGNYSFGDKETSRNSPSFDADQFSIVGGLDYRFSDSAVLGGSLAYGESSIEFTGEEGALDTESWAASLYGSVYAAKNFYFDGIVNVANSGYDAERNITYVDGTGLVTADASGDTDGLTLSGGLSGGYDFLIGGLTISPTLGVFYIDTTIDGFTEEGAGGLNLIYDEQKFESLTGNLGLRATFAWNLSWGVLLPHLRVDYVREFEDDVDVFGVRFAADPNAVSTPPILVETDNPDQSYWRLAAGFSAQFKYGFSGYVEYQRLESFEFINFQDVSIGLRMQRSF
jgi:outer membrane autotransporter protein